MKNKIEEAEKLTAHELIMLSKIRMNSGIIQKGYFESEAILFLLKKLGIKDEELKQLRLNAIRNNKKTAQEFQEIIKSKPLPINDIVNELALELARPNLQMQQNRDLPSSKIRVYPSSPYSHVYSKGVGIHEKKELYKGFGSAVSYKFEVQSKGLYNFSLPVVACAPYFMTADDGPCFGESAELIVNANVSVVKQNIAPDEIPVFNQQFNLFKKLILNGRILDNLIVGREIGSLNPYFYYDSNNQSVMQNNTVFIPCEVGEKLAINVQVVIYIEVYGECAMVDADFSPGTGTLYNPYMDIIWIGNP